MRTRWIVCWLLCTHLVQAQTTLEWKSKAFCAYGADNVPQSVRTLPASKEVEDLVAEILLKTGQNQSFELVVCNVASVVAVLEPTPVKLYPKQAKPATRYLLYNSQYFAEQKDLLYKYATLAHEMAHHIFEHQLTAVRRSAEEAEADDFTGYALFLVGQRKQDLQRLTVQGFHATEEEKAVRLATLERGFARSEASLLLLAGAGFADDGSGNAIPGIPEYPIPPPPAAAQCPLEEHFQKCRNLGEVNKRLVAALEKNGYYEKSYFYVKGGFALATRMEQIRKDGYSMGEASRWKSKPVREEGFSVTGYLRSLFTSEPGYFRVFVFIVTDEPLQNSNRRSVDPGIIESWTEAGVCRLPASIASWAFKKEKTQVQAFVYEFTKSTSGGEGTAIAKSEQNGFQHLERANILSALKR